MTRKYHEIVAHNIVYPETAFFLRINHQIKNFPKRVKRNNGTVRIGKKFDIFLYIKDLNFRFGRG